MNSQGWVLAVNTGTLSLRPLPQERGAQLCKSSLVEFQKFGPGRSGGISDHVRAWCLQGGLESAQGQSHTLAGEERSAQKLGVPGVDLWPCFSLHRGGEMKPPDGLRELMMSRSVA